MSGVVMVTGASSGLGRATCDLLAQRGWTVIGGSRRGTGGYRWEGVVLDVDNDDSVSTACNGVIERHGRIDAVVCSAGFGVAGPVELTTYENARAQLETNFWGTVRVAVSVLPHMRAAGHGRIIIMSSIAGQIGIPFQAYYSASKFALEGWAESLAYEIAPFGIHVTLVQPGNFATEFTDSRRSVSSALGPYEDAASHAIGVMESDERNGAAPSLVASEIVHQLESTRPRRRVSVGKPGERFGLVAKRVLPHHWFERVAKDSLGVR
jgi:NAD(P)-dependent dehydrogenase (short-subunit alcohol dehydrogenase family)